MTHRFGKLARGARIRARKSLRDVANVIGFSIAHVSDVERGHRNPPASDIVRYWAEFLEADPELFDWYARLDRRSVELMVDQDHEGALRNQAAIALARSWNELGDDEYREILRVVGSRHDGE